MLALERGARSMGGAVRITRRDLTAKDLRAAAGREKDGSAARRMLALAMVLDGVDRKSAAESCGMDRQTGGGERGYEPPAFAGLGAPQHRGGRGRPAHFEAAGPKAKTHSGAAGR